MNRQLKAEIVLHFGNQCDAAVALDVPESRLSRIINGRILPSSKEMEAFVKAFGVERINTLLGGGDHSPNAA